MSGSTVSEILLADSLDDAVYLPLLEKLIGETEFLQDSPPEWLPQETRAANHVLDALRPYTVENGGPLIVELVEYEAGRGNVLITYPGKSADKCVSFVGSHLDVVPADPATWERPPFKLIVEGDRLYGRGTTDCLGHVAMITCLFAKLAQLKPDLDISVHAVFIASEEATAKPGVGVDGLMAAGQLAKLKGGPLFWVDSADTHPCIGTAGALTWHLTAHGKLFHSGLPHKTVNPIELGMEALKAIQDRFYRDFPAHPAEAEYKFQTPSTMKPTKLSSPKGGINQIPAECTISGDVRLTPFYTIEAVSAALTGYVAELNASITDLPARGPVSKYDIPALGVRGRLEITFGAEPAIGIACDLASPGLKALCDGIEVATGKKAEPYSIGGSLPLVDTLKTAGYDVQIVGFGLMSTYHAANEYCLLSGMKHGYTSFLHVIDALNKAAL